jgi:hypothetical protein
MIAAASLLLSDWAKAFSEQISTNANNRHLLGATG